jgi:hypothetical protein
VIATVVLSDVANRHTVRVIQGSHSGYTALLELNLHAFGATTYHVTMIPFLHTDVYMMFVYITMAWFSGGTLLTIRVCCAVTKAKRD